MKRLIVALDGTKYAEEILPDARRVAGPDGELILVHTSNAVLFHPAAANAAGPPESDATEDYLDAVAAKLRKSGARVTTHAVLAGSDGLRHSLDAAPASFGADLIALATHGRGIAGQLVHGGFAWRVLAHSPVPVLIRHIDTHAPLGDPFARPEMSSRHILVPLDGSQLAEAALPIAAEMARQWSSALTCVRVIPDPAMIWQASAWGGMAQVPINSQVIEDETRDDARQYLAAIAERFPAGACATKLCEGHVADELVAITTELGITDLVMASHGRSGLARVILGSVADGLIQRLHLPMIVVPALAACSSEADKRHVASVAG